MFTNVSHALSNCLSSLAASCLPGIRADANAPSHRPRLDAERRATIALGHVEGIGTATLRTLKAAFHSLTEALAEPRQRLLPFLHTDQARDALLAVPDFDEKADAVLEQLDALHARPLFPDDEGWPLQLREVEDAPPFLCVRGHLDALQPRLAVVGARAVDDYGRAITCFWAGETARKGIAIVSGGARGVDSQAHLAALDVHGVTIAVLATGIDQVYPPQNDSLFERIVERGGALVSQFPIGMQPFKRNFILRNGLIAALSNATLVTRAAHDSGALTTAQDTRALGRSVFVLPGDLSSPLSWGVQRLVESGLATSISGLDPIGQLFGIPGPWPAFLIPSPPGRGSSHRASRPLQAESASLVMKAERRPDALREGRQDEITGLSSPLQAQSRGAARPLPPLEEKFLNVFNQLEILPRQFDELLAQSALDAAGLADALLRLEVLGLCEERPGRFFRRTTPGSGP